MHLTLRDVLELPVMAAGAPVVRSAADAVDVPVRSVHVSELSDVAGTLTSDVLVLSIGRAFTEPGFDAVAYVRSLRDAGAIGLVVEPGQHLKSLPDALVQAARAARFPLVELRSTVRFIEVTEIVHARIVNAHYERLRLAERAHEAFSTVGSASQAPDAVLAHAADLIGLPVVLEDRTHRALAFMRRRFGGIAAARLVSPVPAGAVFRGDRGRRPGGLDVHAGGAAARTLG